MLFQWMRKHLFCAVGFTCAGLLSQWSIFVDRNGMNLNRKKINCYNEGDSAQKKQFFRLISMHCRRVARMACLAMDFRRHFNFSKVFVCWARGESVYAVAVCFSSVVRARRHRHMQSAPATNRTLYSHSTGNWRRTHTYKLIHTVMCANGRKEEMCKCQRSAFNHLFRHCAESYFVHAHRNVAAEHE